MINILIRTSNRPKSFKRLIDSIASQTLSPIKYRLIISVDSDVDYVDEVEDLHNVSIIDVEKQNVPFFWNLYLNELLEYVAEGWVLVIDDDDFLHNNNSLVNLHNILKDEDTLYLFKILHGGKYPIPNKMCWDRNNLVRGQISMSGFSYHIKHKPVYEARQSADFYAASELFKKLKRKWCNITVVQTGNLGLRGELKDIE